jgi:hypothetical protein
MYDFTPFSALKCEYIFKINQNENFESRVGSNDFIFWLQGEGRINFGWCISTWNHSHLLEKELYYQKNSTFF